MRATRRCLWTLCLLGATAAQGQTSRPEIGYVYPAGAQQGTTVTLTVGGQALRQAEGIVVSGEGVHGKVVRYVRPLRNLQRDQREWLQKQMLSVRNERLVEVYRHSGGKYGASRKSLAPKTAAARRKASGAKTDPNTPPMRLPDHPLLTDLEQQSLRQLAHLRSVLFFPRTKLQMNRQLAEMLVIELTVDADAPCGDRYLRVATRTGMTNPIRFQVGCLPEVRELEPNNREAYPPVTGLPRGVSLPPEKPLSLPVLLNGQILPGDVDRFRFTAKKGRRVVVDVRARHLIPYLADAVPGWFQAVVSLFDAQGREVAFADDYQFHPDPVLMFTIPADGDYELAIHDSIFRGREDFVYRVAVGELPFITQAFPLGGRLDSPTQATIHGWNLPATKLTLDTGRGPERLRETHLSGAEGFSNAVAYAVDVLPELDEAAANDSPDEAQGLKLPRIVNGRIERPGDADVFRIEGRAGQPIVAEVLARRLNSPLDGLLRLTDATGKVLAWNDDFVVKDAWLFKDLMGRLTHHADPRLTVTFPRDGVYYLQLTDAEGHGGPAYAYRLRVSAPRPDFALRVTPSSGFARAGAIVPLTVHVLRTDGFDEAIQLSLRNAPAGFRLEGGRIPPGGERVQVTLVTPNQGTGQPTELVIEGLAHVKGRTLRHRAVAAEDVMQAFLYRHLLPVEALYVTVQRGRGRLPTVAVDGSGPVQIPAGGSTRVRLRTRLNATLIKELILELNDAPTGLTLEDVRPEEGGLSFQVHATTEDLTPGYADNLVLRAWREFYPKSRDGKVSKTKSRYLWGYLPAIPFEVVKGTSARSAG